MNCFSSRFLFQGNKAKGFEFVGQKYDHASEIPFSESDAATLLRCVT